MAGDRRMYVTIAIVSAVLAAFVPGIVDTPALATSALAGQPSVSVSEQVIETVSTAKPVEKQQDVAVARTMPVVAKATRARIPVGCERVVSPLVRSAAASQLSRCVT